jgi:hypothetical protein
MYKGNKNVKLLIYLFTPANIRRPDSGTLMMTKIWTQVPEFMIFVEVRTL